MQSYTNEDNWLKFKVDNLFVYRSKKYYANKNKDIIKIIKKQLLNDRYIMVSLDEYYVPDRSAYGRSHYLHANWFNDGVNRSSFVKTDMNLWQPRNFFAAVAFLHC